MSCDFDILLLSGHIDAMNTPEEERQLSEHLNSCEQCRALLAQMQKNDENIRILEAKVPQDLTQRIMQQVKNQPKKPKRYRTLITCGLAAAAVLAIAFVGKLALPEQPDKSAQMPMTEQKTVVYGGKTDAPTVCVETEPAEFAEDPIPMAAADGEVHASKRAPSNTPGILVLKIDDKTPMIDGELINADEVAPLLRKSEYAISGNETAFYSVSCDEFMRIIEKYGDRAEHYYTEDVMHATYVIILVK